MNLFPISRRTARACLARGKRPSAWIAAISLLALPLLARADHNPDFDRDAKPILAGQPDLVQYVHSNFEVTRTGIARVPGDSAHPPAPPFIFHARPRGTRGDYYLTLLIQPGPPGRILKVIDPTRPGGRYAGPTRGPLQPPSAPQPPATASEPEPPPAEEPQPAEQQPAPPSQPAASSSAGAPTANTPSGPILPNGQTSTNLDLAPPPDPAPAR